MKAIFGLALMTVLGTAGSARAEWEGCIDSKLTSGEMNGDIHTCFAKIGWRAQVEMKVPQMGETPTRVVWLGKLSKPDVAYIVNESTQSYAERNLREDEAAAAKLKKPDERKKTVKKLTPEKVLDFKCEHVMITDADGKQTEVWVTKDLFSAGAMDQLMSRRDRGGGMMKDLKSAGVEGFPIKIVQREPNHQQPKMTMEPVKAEQKSLPASSFEVPAGYQKVGIGQVMMSAEQRAKAGEADRRTGEKLKSMSPEQRKELEETLKNMPPEARQRYEEMMKGQGAQ